MGVDGRKEAEDRREYERSIWRIKEEAGLRTPASARELYDWKKIENGTSIWRWGALNLSEYPLRWQEKSTEEKGKNAIKRNKASGTLFSPEIESLRYHFAGARDASGQRCQILQILMDGGECWTDAIGKYDCLDAGETRFKLYAFEWVS